MTCQAPSASCSWNALGLRPRKPAFSRRFCLVTAASRLSKVGAHRGAFCSGLHQTRGVNQSCTDAATLQRPREVREFLRGLCGVVAEDKAQKPGRCDVRGTFRGLLPQGREGHVCLPFRTRPPRAWPRHRFSAFRIFHTLQTAQFGTEEMVKKKSSNMDVFGKTRCSNLKFQLWHFAWRLIQRFCS